MARGKNTEVTGKKLLLMQEKRLETLKLARQQNQLLPLL